MAPEFYVALFFVSFAPVEWWLSATGVVSSRVQLGPLVWIVDME